MKLELPQWYDLHAHFRQGDMVAPLIAEHLAMGCAGILAMPNTKPPVGKIFKKDSLPYWSIEEYLKMLRDSGGNKFTDIIVPLYLTKDTTPKMIEEGARAGVLRACKYYPPHGTTGAEFGIPFETFLGNGVFKALEDTGTVLCIHGEEHGLKPGQYFDRTMNAEEYFYRERLPKAVDLFPKLKIVGEHLTTKTGVEFIRKAPSNIMASITPQHLLYTIGDLVQGLKYHLYCLPLVKFEEDRQTLRQAVTDPENTKFFAGTDSAPHTTKATDCGCAAGCYTGGIAPQLYAEAFERAGAQLNTATGAEAFKKFLCMIGPIFYGLKIPKETFTLEKASQNIKPLKIGSQSVMPLPLGMQENSHISWKITT